MQLIAKSSGDSDRPLPTAGMQQGVLYSIIVLGTQESEYMGTKKNQFKFNVGWELPHLPKLEYEDNGQKIMRPQCVFKTYVLSLYAKSNLAQDLVGWRGMGFSKEEENGYDVFGMFKIGANVLLQITHYEGKDGKMKAKYIGISPLMAGMPTVQPENPLVEYEPSMRDSFPEGMPDWAKEAVAKSPEYQGITSATENEDLQKVTESMNGQDNPDWVDDEPIGDDPFIHNCNICHKDTDKVDSLGICDSCLAKQNS